MKIFTLTLSICVLLILLSGCSGNSSITKHEKIRVLLDTDANNELDDQHAIAYMLLNGQVFDVDGITTNATRSGGNVEEHTKEAERIVKLCDLYPQIKVYTGANGSFDEIKDHLNENTFDGSEAVNFIISRAHAVDGRKLVLIPVGKLTNIALALKKDPSIASKVRIVWLGSNYPETGGYNFSNDIDAVSYVLQTEVDFEIAVVREGEPSGTAAVRVTPEEIKNKMPGKGPHISEPVIGRHGQTFDNFGDYSVNLFEHIYLTGDPPSRALYDMAAVAIVKNPTWATSKIIPRPKLKEGNWIDQPNNPKTIIIWENFDRKNILNDFFNSMEDYMFPDIK